MRTPCIKFVAETASFFTFLTIIVGNSFAERDKLCDTSLADDPRAQEYWSHVGANVTARYSLTNTCVRNHKPEPLQITLSLWICGEYILIPILILTNPGICNHKPEPLQITLSLWICGEYILIPILILTNPGILNHKPDPLQITLSLWICGEYIIIPILIPILIMILLFTLIHGNYRGLLVCR